MIYIKTKIKSEETIPPEYVNTFVIEGYHDHNDGDDVPAKWKIFDRYELEFFLSFNNFLRNFHRLSRIEDHELDTICDYFIVDFTETFGHPPRNPINYSNKIATSDSIKQWYKDLFVSYTNYGDTLLPQVTGVYYYDIKSNKFPVETTKHES